MRKGVTFAMIFTGTILSVFVINLAFFAMVPEYHDALVAAVSTSRIPVVRADQSMEIEDAFTRTVPASGEDVYSNVNTVNLNTSYKSERVLTPEDILGEHESSLTPLAASPDTTREEKAVIVDREYHEDCGTGKGYWVITYSDGSTVIE